MIGPKHFISLPLVELEDFYVTHSVCVRCHVCCVYIVTKKCWINIYVVTKLLTGPKLGIIQKKTEHSIWGSCKSPIVNMSWTSLVRKE